MFNRGSNASLVDSEFNKIAGYVSKISINSLNTKVAII